jgi:carbon storage regulator
MLILIRKIGEKIIVGDEITITVLTSKGTQIRLGINAPIQVSILTAFEITIFSLKVAVSIFRDRLPTQASLRDGNLRGEKSASPLKNPHRLVCT